MQCEEKMSQNKLGGYDFWIPMKIFFLEFPPALISLMCLCKVRAIHILGLTLA